MGEPTATMRVLDRHLSREELDAGLDHIRRPSSDDGTLELIVRRPHVDGREVLDTAELSLTHGVVGDSWIDRPSGRRTDGKAHPDMQLNIINARLSRLIA